MKHFFFFVCAFFALVIPTLSLPCPTCIGLPTKESRPFFEHRGIRYVIKLDAETKKPLKPEKPLRKKHK